MPAPYTARWLYHTCTHRVYSSTGSSAVLRWTFTTHATYVLPATTLFVRGLVLHVPYRFCHLYHTYLPHTTCCRYLRLDGYLDGRFTTPPDGSRCAGLHTYAVWFTPSTARAVLDYRGLPVGSHLHRTYRSAGYGWFDSACRTVTYVWFCLHIYLYGCTGSCTPRLLRRWLYTGARLLPTTCPRVPLPTTFTYLSRLPCTAYLQFTFIYYVLCRFGPPTRTFILHYSWLVVAVPLPAVDYVRTTIRLLHRCTTLLRTYLPVIAPSHVHAFSTARYRCPLRRIGCTLPAALPCLRAFCSSMPLVLPLPCYLPT